MATVTGVTAERAIAIEAASIVSGEIVGDNLFLTNHGGASIDAGVVKGDTGATGATGAPGSDGVGIPVGGVAGQALLKLDSDDYTVVWGEAIRAITLNPQTLNYTLQLGDEEDMVLMDSTSANVVTVPLHSAVAFPLGTRIRIAQINTGNTSIGFTAGVTLRYPTSYTPNLAGQGATVELIKIADDVWILDSHGNLATTLGWQIYTPTIVGSTSGPTLGGNSIRKGYYIVDSNKRVIGGATVRFGTTGSPGRGSGNYRLLLPVEGINYDNDGYSPIGSGSIGIGITHTTGELHFDGANGVTTRALIAMNGGLFVTGAAPAGTASDANVHWSFAYQAL